MLARVFFATLVLSTFGLAVADEPTQKKSVTEKLKDLRTQFNKANTEAIKAINAEKDAKKRQQLIANYTNGRNTFAAKVLDLAKSDPKDEGAMAAILSAMSMGNAKVSSEASAFLVEQFGDDDKLATAIPQMVSSEGGQRAVEKLGQKSKSKLVRASARFGLVKEMVESADYPRNQKRPSAEESARVFADAAARLKTIVSEYGDVKLKGPRGSLGTVAENSKKLTFFIENLTVGKKAPLVECGTLEEDKKDKLSNYRGKVVVLDVWATWCGPCVAMIPHEREMVKKLKDKPFALISVSADEKKETLTKFLAKKEMPWTHWWNGRTGNVLDTLQVRFYPTIYVIDAKGVIRYKHLRGAALEEAVEKLIAEMQISTTE